MAEHGGLIAHERGVMAEHGALIAHDGALTASDRPFFVEQGLLLDEERRSMADKSPSSANEPSFSAHEVAINASSGAKSSVVISSCAAPASSMAAES